jgi:hypothetical protein
VRDIRFTAAKIFALSLCPPPAGYERWNVVLLHKKALERGIAEFISVKVIYEILKKYQEGEYVVLAESPSRSETGE